MESGGEATIMDIDLFFRPGHYDACYRKDLYEKLKR